MVPCNFRGPSALLVGPPAELAERAAAALICRSSRDVPDRLELVIRSGSGAERRMHRCTEGEAETQRVERL